MEDNNQQVISSSNNNTNESKSKIQTSTVNNTNTVNNTAQQEPEKPKSFFKNLMYFFLAYTVVTSIIPYFVVITPQHNLLTHNDELKLKFYISEKNNLKYISDFNKLTPVKEIDTYYNVFDNIDPIEFNVTTSILLEDNLTDKMIEQKSLYLYVTGNLIDEKLMNEIEKTFKNVGTEGLFMSKINLVKYIPNFKKKIQELEMAYSEEQGLQSSFTKEEIKSETSDTSNTELETTNTNSIESFENTLSHLYYKPQITYYLTSVDKQVDKNSIAELSFLKTNHKYHPTFQSFIPPTTLSDFWLMTKEYKPVNKTDNNDLNIKIEIRSIGITKFKFLMQFDMQNELMTNEFGMESSKDLVVELLKTNSSNYLILLFTVQTLHMLFSFLGFASDISYHKKIERLDGLYTKIYFVRLFHYLVAVIYYYMEDVSKIIYFELIISLAIELWKFRKIFSTKITSSFPFIKFENRIKYDENESSSLEEEAITKTSKVLFIPLALIYLAYRSYYYSSYIYLHPFRFIIEYFFFLLNIFGFVMMTPQIYINYKLKSVEHMPMKTFAFKFLNTIIDDIFAFALETPTLHRISVFKDDIIFVIFVGQMIIYRNNKRFESIEGNKEKVEKELVSETIEMNKMIPETDQNKEIKSDTNIDDDQKEKSLLEKKND